MSFTPEQLEHYVAYEQIKLSGEYNMFDPRAAQATGLSRYEYLFVMDHYDGLRKQYEASNDPVQLEN